MKIVTVIGARPQFIKAAVVSRAIRKSQGIEEMIIHTGQHYDQKMSDVFFEEMQIPKPHYHLDIHGLSHGAMTGQMMEKTEEVLLAEKPDWVLVYGDTNSTLAGALAASKLHIKVAHVEAGLRSFNMKMPEEINRIITDRLSSLLFCPTLNAVENLKKEGFGSFPCKMIETGDVMYDAALFYHGMARKPQMNIPDEYILSTIHRAENTDDPERLSNIFEALLEISATKAIIIPLHPRTHKLLEKTGISQRIKNSSISIIEPVGYLEMIYLTSHASLIMTDSGGLQKEAFFFKKPCITLRDETEWIELVTSGNNIIAGANKSKILSAFQFALKKDFSFNHNLYGDGTSGKKIVNHLLNHS